MSVCITLTALIALVQAAQSAPATSQPTTAQAVLERSRAEGLAPRVKLQTSAGDIVLELDGLQAPIATQNFVRYVEEGFYDGTVFHRLIKPSILQGGAYTPDLERKTKGLHEPILNEWLNRVPHNRGTIATAPIGQDPDSATVEFFINLRNNPQLSGARRGGGGFPVFGRVIEGLEVVDKIGEMETVEHRKFPGRTPATLKDPVLIKAAKVVLPANRDALKRNADRAIAAIDEFKKVIREQAATAIQAQQPALEKHITQLEQQTGKKFHKDPSGVQWLTLTEGSGASPTLQNTVEVHYTGWLLDGKKFDSTRDRNKPEMLPLNGVMKGWQIALPTMKIGEHRRIIVPPELGYGAEGFSPKVPPNVYLVFDIELIAFE